MTIVEAIKEVLGRLGEPRTVDEIYMDVLAHGLYSFKAVDPKSVVRSQLRRHCLGLEFPSASPLKFFRLVDDDKYSLDSKEGVRTSPQTATASQCGRIPEELIDDAHKQHLVSLRQQLKEKIRENHPAFFERLVIELLLKMGYGGSDPSLGLHTGGPGDGGIDGIIKEDKLGLEQIYIQAKRYALERDVKRTEVQQFAGAMNKVKKGVFITTASFARRAIDFAKSHEKTISLIDGDLLCDLMIHNGVGISELKTYRIMRVDNGYFSSNE